MNKRLFLTLWLFFSTAIATALDFTQAEIAQILQPWDIAYMPKADVPEYLFLSPLAGSYGLLNDVHRGLIKDPLNLRKAYDPEEVIYNKVLKHFFYLQDTSVHATQKVDAPANVLVQSGLLGLFAFNCFNNNPLESFYQDLHKQVLGKQFMINKLKGEIENLGVVDGLVGEYEKYIDLRGKLDELSRTSPTKGLSREGIKVAKDSIQQRINRWREVTIDEKTFKLTDLFKETEKFLNDNIPLFYQDLQTIIAHESNTRYPRGITQLIISMYLVQRAHDIGNPELIKRYTAFFAENASSRDETVIPLLLDPTFILPIDTVLPPRQPYALVKSSANPFVQNVLCVEKSLIDLFNIFLYNSVKGNFDIDRIPDSALQEFKDIYARINEKFKSTAQSRDNLIQILESEEILDLWGQLFAQKDPIFYRRKDHKLDVAAGTNNIFTLVRIIMGQAPHPQSNTSVPARQPKIPWSDNDQWSDAAIAQEMNSIMTLFGVQNIKPVNSSEVTRQVSGKETPDAKVRAQIELTSIDGTKIIWDINSGHSEVNTQKPLAKRSSLAASSSSSEAILVNPLMDLNQDCLSESHFHSIDAALLYPLSCTDGSLDHIDNGLCLFTHNYYEQADILYLRLLDESLEAGDYFHVLSVINAESPLVEKYFLSLSTGDLEKKGTVWSKALAAMHRLKTQSSESRQIRQNIAALEAYFYSLSEDEQEAIISKSRYDFIRTPSPAILESSSAATASSSMELLPMTEAQVFLPASSQIQMPIPIRREVMSNQEELGDDLMEELSRQNTGI